MCIHQLYPPPQLKHQYIDYTNGSSIVCGQKLHVDFDYGNGLDRLSVAMEGPILHRSMHIDPHTKMYG